MKHILITGATGTVGSQVVSQLLATDCHIRALSRNPDELSLPPRVEVVYGDLMDPDTLNTCLAGIDTIFLVWTAPVSSAPAMVNRIAQYAKRIVLLTSPHKTPHPFFQQPNPLRKVHAEIERLVETSGIRWTFLRPGMFADNALAWWAPQIRTGNAVRWPYAGAPTAPIDVRDIAAVAVRVLLDEGHDRAEYVITGPESLTQREQVQTISDEIGRPIGFEELTPDEARLELGFPEAAMNMLLDAWAAAVGQPAYISTAVEEITGTPPSTFREWVAEHAAAFKPD